MNFTPEIFLRLALGLGLFAFGWILFRFGLRAAGFGLGYVFGSSVYELLLAWVKALNEEWLRFFPDHPYAPILFGVVIGIVGVLLVKRMYLVMVFIGVLAGSLYLLYADENQRRLVEQLFAWIGILDALNNTVGTLWPAVLALLVALLFLYFQKQLIILLTACMGAYLLADTVDIPMAFLPLCFVGYLLQTVKRPKRTTAKEETV